jgi:hypothetical protein
MGAQDHAMVCFLSAASVVVDALKTGFFTLTLPVSMGVFWGTSEHHCGDYKETKHTGRQHFVLAQAAEAAGRGKGGGEKYLKAWRYYSFARWPTVNSPGKVKPIGWHWKLSATMHVS